MASSGSASTSASLPLHLLAQELRDAIQAEMLYNKAGEHVDYNFEPTAPSASWIGLVARESELPADLRQDLRRHLVAGNVLILPVVTNVANASASGDLAPPTAKLFDAQRLPFAIRNGVKTLRLTQLSAVEAVSVPGAPNMRTARLVIPAGSAFVRPSADSCQHPPPFDFAELSSLDGLASLQVLAADEQYRAGVVWDLSTSGGGPLAGQLSAITRLPGRPLVLQVDLRRWLRSTGTTAADVRIDAPIWTHLTTGNAAITALFAAVFNVAPETMRLEVWCPPLAQFGLARGSAAARDAISALASHWLSALRDARNAGEYLMAGSRAWQEVVVRGDDEF